MHVWFLHSSGWEWCWSAEAEAAAWWNLLPRPPAGLQPHCLSSVNQNPKPIVKCNLCSVAAQCRTTQSDATVTLPTLCVRWVILFVDSRHCSEMVAERNGHIGYGSCPCSSTPLPNVSGPRKCAHTSQTKNGVKHARASCRLSSMSAPWAWPPECSETAR